jgi:ribosomal subunit interface protein
MEKPVQLAWHGLRRSKAVGDLVREKVAWLERYHERIIGCRVTLELASHHHREGGALYRVRIELSVPKAKLVVGRDPEKSRDHADLEAAINAAFHEARRQLQDHARRIDGR